MGFLATRYVAIGSFCAGVGTGVGTGVGCFGCGEYELDDYCFVDQGMDTGSCLRHLRYLNSG